MPKIEPPDFLLKVLGRQLGEPSGILGALVARMLNKSNRTTIAAAVEASALRGSERVADIGFGGGLGLDLLLEAVPDGTVHGVEPSEDMRTRARKRHSDAVAAGRLVLHDASLQALPFDDAALDGWISLNTIYFIDDVAQASDELTRVLSPTGRGVLGVADPDWMAQQAFTRHTFTLRPIADVIRTLETSGLSVKRRTAQGNGPPYNLLICTPDPLRM